MWSDTLLQLERLHFQRLALWGLLALAAGATISLLLMRRYVGALLARHFATQTAALGALVAAWAGSGMGGLALRDHASALRLQSAIGLFSLVAAGIAIAGTLLATMGWRRRRPGFAGTGLALLMHGTVLFVLHRTFAGQIRV